MIVVDASALTELLTDEQGAAQLVREHLAADTVWAGPEHVRIEVVNALRGLWLGGRTTDGQFDGQLEGLARMSVVLLPLPPLIPRIRALANNATAYDAAYLALAESLGAPLVTADAKLAKVPGARAEIRLVPVV